MAKGNNLTASSTGTALAYSETPPETMGTERSAEEIRQNIAATRESITETVDRLSDRVHQTFDWRTHVSNYPVAAVGVAVGLGLLAAGIFKHRPTPAERMKEALADGFEDFTDRFRSQIETVTTRRPNLNQTVKAAATGFLVKAATEFLRNRVSGDQRQRFEGQEERGEATNHSRMTRPINRGQWSS